MVKVALRKLVDGLVDAQQRGLEAIATEVGVRFLDLALFRVVDVVQNTVEELCG
jgi:hypothetical protein